MTNSFQFWTLYFEDEPEIPIQSTISFFTNHFKQSLSNSELEKIKEIYQFNIPYTQLIHILSNKIPNIEQLIANQTNLDEKYNFNLFNILTSISCSITNLINQPIRIQLRITEPDFYTPFDLINVKSINKLVNIKGTIIKSEPKNYFIRKLTYECSQCKEIIKLNTNIYKIPNKCKNNCKFKIFKLIQTNQSIYIYQNLILKNKELEIKIQLHDYFVNYVQCGDMIEVLGCLLVDTIDNKRYQMYIKVFNIIRIKELSEYIKTKEDNGIINYEVEKFIGRSSQPLHNNNLHNNNLIIINNNNNNNNNLNNNLLLKNNNLINNNLLINSGNINISSSEDDFFNDLLQMNVNYSSLNNELIRNNLPAMFSNLNEKEIISSIINSLFPEIFGNELIKLALTFSIFGGSIRYCNSVKLRNTINTLIVGPPGLGKTLFLQTLSKIFPKSIYTDNSKNLFYTENSKISFSKEIKSKDLSFKNDFSKDNNFNEYFLEINSILQSNNSICCIDNFNLFNQFNLLGTEQEIKLKNNLKIKIPNNTTIIGAINSKELKNNYLFDIIILISDELNEQLSKQVSDHILINKRNKENINEIIDLIKTDPFIYNLKCTIKTRKIQEKELINYILYAKENINPIIKPESFNKIKEFCKTNKLQSQSFEVLVKICECRAKLVYRSIANLEDATFAIQFYQRLIKNQNSKNEKKGYKAFIESLRDKSVISYKEIESLIESKLCNKIPGQVISSLNSQGVLIKVGKDEYRINHSAII